MPVIFSVVDADGTQADGNAVSIQHTVAGEYRLTFSRNLDDCAVVASPGGHRTTASTDGSTVSVITRVVSPPGVMQPTDRSFHLIVMCPAG